MFLREQLEMEFPKEVELGKDPWSSAAFFLVCSGRDRSWYMVASPLNQKMEAILQ